MTVISSFVALFLVLMISLIITGVLLYITCKSCFILQFRRSLHKLLLAENKIYRRALWFKPKYIVFFEDIFSSLKRLLLCFLLLLTCLCYVINL